MELFPHNLERVSGTLTSMGDVRVPHGANADYVVDQLGREWVRKKELETGFQPFLAEAFGALFAMQLEVCVPDAAVYIEDDNRAWLSSLLHDVTHWDSAKLPFISNIEVLGPAFALDAILFNEDRHRGNILLQSMDDDQDQLQVWAIDMGNALVGFPTDFFSLDKSIPDPRNLAPGIPVTRLEATAMETAQRATTISKATIHQYAQEACALVHEKTVDQYTDVLYLRCKSATSIVSRYLALIKSLR